MGCEMFAEKGVMRGEAGDVNELRLAQVRSGEK